MGTIEVWFRFYEELNDFLPSEFKGISFARKLKGNPPVKDAIEAIGVPHVDVDLILINGNPSSFDRKLADGDHVSIYPVFESFDISGISPLRAKPLRETRFVADVHLGKLARHLRLCGFDSVYNSHFSDPEIIAVSLAEKRIILTRDRGILKNKIVTHGYWIRSADPSIQLAEVISRFDLAAALKPFTICMECNGSLTEVPKEAILDRLLPLTRKFYSVFKQCTGCGRIYWEGSHFHRMEEFISRIIRG